MTFDLILSSLYYKEKEWFVFQDILTHLPHEKAAAAMQRSKATSEKYAYRFGIPRDWVTGDSKKGLIERHFIDSNDTGRSLIFSSALIEYKNVRELFQESFTKKFRLKVKQFHLTANSLQPCWFEWQFDPKQKGDDIIKKTKLTADENDREPLVSSNGPDKTPQYNQNRHSDCENLAPNLSSQSTESPLSLKRRRSGNQSASDFSPSISESVFMRPKKKAREGNVSISKQFNDNERQDDEIPAKEEPMSLDYKPDLNNLHVPDIKMKRSLSPMEKPKIKLSPNSSTETIVKNDVMLSSASVTDIIADSDTDCNHSNIDIPQADNVSPKNSDNLNQIDELPVQSNEDSAMENNNESSIGNDVSQVNMVLDNQEMPGESNDADRGNPGFNNTLDDSSIPSNSPVGNSMEDSNSTDDGNVPDGNVPDDNLVPQNIPQAPSSPTSSLLDNSKDIMENIKLREQELCNDEDGDTTSEVPSTSADTNSQAATHKHDCGAETCNSNGASSTVCLCADQETSKKEKPTESVGSTEASELLDGLKAAGFIDHVRQLLENFQGDTRLSKMEAELNTLRNQINQKRKANSQLQKSIKKKAGELEKLFENLRKGKAHCEMLEQKHKALQVEKSTVEAKVKKCLEVLNSVE